MRVGLVPRAARGAALAAAVTTVAAGCLATSAMAATSTISVTNNTATPEQAVPVDLTFAGTNGSTDNAQVDAVVRPAGGLGCQATYQEDVSTLGVEDTTILAPGGQTLAPGAFQVTASYKPPSPGSYQVCAWLDASQTGTSSQAPPVSVNFTAQGPQVSEFTIGVPKTLTPNDAFQITYTTQTDQQLSLYSTIQPAGTTTARPCAASYELETQPGRSQSTLVGVEGVAVFGGPTTTTATTTQKTGDYLICSWLEGPNPGQVDKTLSTPITVGTPVAPLPPKPALKLTKVTASHRHGVSAAGATASGFSGRLQLTAACGAAITRRTVTARNRRFSATFGLPRACRVGHKVKFTVSWAGSTAWSKQSATRSVAIGK